MFREFEAGRARFFVGTLIQTLRVPCLARLRTQETHNEGIDAAIAINYALGKPIILVGHSWGAYAAMTAAYRAAKKGIRVDLLETIDPVDGPIKAFNSVTPNNIDDLKPMVGLWVDVRATKYETDPDWSDWIATKGDRFDSASQSRADVYLETKRNHADFEEMYHEVLTDRMIQGIYYNHNHK
jgi:pimeloyl-ACP methyl ester carboxylesterase